VLHTWQFIDHIAWICNFVWRHDESSRQYTQLKQFKYMIFHIFICILHLLRVCYELTMSPAPHRYRRGHGFESRLDGNWFFSGFYFTAACWVYNCHDQSCLHVSLCSNLIFHIFMCIYCLYIHWQCLRPAVRYFTQGSGAAQYIWRGSDHVFSRYCNIIFW